MSTLVNSLNFFSLEISFGLLVKQEEVLKSAEKKQEGKDVRELSLMVEV